MVGGAEVSGVMATPTTERSPSRASLPPGEVEAYEDEDDAIVLAQTFLSFRVADAGYAVPVAAVREIVRLEKSFEMPDVPSHVRGVINLRGRVIPLIDVRARFGRATRPFDDRTVTVVLDVEGTSVGLVVDDVSEVVELPPGAREPLQQSHGPAAGLVTEAARRQDGLLFVLDLARLVEP